MGSSSNFDQIAQQIIQQKHLMDKLEEENRELRQQISDLKMGRGIFVEIEGQRFALLVSDNAATPDVPEVPMAQDNIQSTNQQQEQAPQIVSVDQQPIPSEQEEKNEKVANPTPSFLEEVLLDEFTSAMTSPVQSVPKPQNEQKKAETSQEQKERLRRELMGSYILE